MPDDSSGSMKAGTLREAALGIDGSVYVHLFRDGFFRKEEESESACAYSKAKKESIEGRAGDSEDNQGNSSKRQTNRSTIDVSRQVDHAKCVV